MLNALKHAFVALALAVVLTPAPLLADPPGDKGKGASTAESKGKDKDNGNDKDNSKDGGKDGGPNHGDVVSEYRVAGQLQVVKVVPSRGPTYYLIDNDGDGRPDDGSPVPPVYWKLFEWN